MASGIEQGFQGKDLSLSDLMKRRQQWNVGELLAEITISEDDRVCRNGCGERMF